MIPQPGHELLIVDDAEKLAREAARRIVARINASTRPAICLTGGSSPARLYQLLGEKPLCDEIPWNRVHWFIGDERFIRETDPLSNVGMTRRLFLDRCAPHQNVHAVPTDNGDLAAAARAYERDLRNFYGAERLDPARPLFDVVLLGIGPDGHVASLFPGSPLDDGDRWVMGASKANVAPFVPRITLTRPVLASCHEMMFLVSGAGKREIFARIQRGDRLPATQIQSNALTTWLVDRAAAVDAP
jgi:6-phosphogluconolactonase